jgi:hypothetical protein
VFTSADVGAEMRRLKGKAISNWAQDANIEELPRVSKRLT